ncbi:MAG: hypothetical protein OHK0038_20410 [Flammeovirgaceae bacterium]
MKKHTIRKTTLKGLESDPFKDALRYLDNAEECIKKAKLDPVLKLYMDKKYVRMAGNTIWNGCLVALETLFGTKKDLKELSKDYVVWQHYRDAYEKKGGGKHFFETAYLKTHILMGYEGKASQSDFLDVVKWSKIIIENCKKWYKEKKK